MPNNHHIVSHGIHFLPLLPQHSINGFNYRSKVSDPGIGSCDTWTSAIDTVSLNNLQSSDRTLGKMMVSPSHVLVFKKSTMNHEPHQMTSVVFYNRYDLSQVTIRELDPRTQKKNYKRQVHVQQKRIGRREAS